LATSREEGKRILEVAAVRGLRVGCAPDTFLGGGLQTCREAIDNGLIGRPVAAAAFMMSRGPESWHPDPGFFYASGAGPMFDMGPYYLTALIGFMGPVRRVTGSEAISFPERVIGSEPLKGQVFKVEAATLITGILDFAAGGIGTIITSFDVWSSNLPRLEIYGSEGSLSVPDPNTFGGPVRLKRAGDEGWRELPLTHPYTGNSRGLGVADMAHALRSGRPHRAGGEMAYHVLDIMDALAEASKEGRHQELTSRCERPKALPVGLPEGVLDD
jgi:predicted dehydrogenase